MDSVKQAEVLWKLEQIPAASDFTFTTTMSGFVSFSLTECLQCQDSAGRQQGPII